MSGVHHVLLAIDDSEASRRAVAYVSDVLRAAPQFHVRLLHVLPHIPTHLLEHGGGDEPERGAEISRELDDETAAWRRRCEDAAAGLMDAVRRTLEHAGVAPDRIFVEFAAPLPEETIGVHILRAADALPCNTVVVGRAPRSWLAGAFHRSASKALLRQRARGAAIWIVT